MEKEMNETLSKVHDMNRQVEKCISLLEDTLAYNRMKSLDECESIAGEIHRAEKELTGVLIKVSKENEEVKRYIAVPGHLERIGHRIEEIIGCLRTKVKGKIIFSEKAMEEATALLEKVKNIMHDSSDFIMSRNEFVAKYIIEAECEIEQNANKFATFHEDRMIEGLCLPEASSIYLHMLDALKGIAWHARQIAEKLGQ